jgi:hypothetical protein
MLFMPGEVVGEMVIGLPAGFDEQPERWFSGSTSLHASGADYDTGGYLLDLMPERYRWTIGLGNDELGYIVPIADWRIRCIAGAACAQLHAGGFIAYPDSLPRLLGRLPTARLSGLPAGRDVPSVASGTCGSRCASTATSSS